MPVASLSEAVQQAVAAGKAGPTWNRYAQAIGSWVPFAESKGSTWLPADPELFAQYLVERAGSGYSQTKQRCCAIEALSTIAGVPSPTTSPVVRAVRTGLLRTLVTRRPKVTPIFAAEIPHGIGDRAPPKGRGSPGRRARMRNAVVRHMAVLSTGALRFDDVQEAQLGDARLFPGMVELSIFGSKTDPLRVGQEAVLAEAEGPGDGPTALMASVREGLDRLTALDAATLAELAPYDYTAVKPLAQSVGFDVTHRCASSPVGATFLAAADSGAVAFDRNPGASDATIITSALPPAYLEILLPLVCGPGTRSQRGATPPRFTHGPNETFVKPAGRRALSALLAVLTRAGHLTPAPATRRGTDILPTSSSSARSS